MNIELKYVKKPCWALLISLLLISSPYAFADWSPESYFWDLDYSAIQNPKYIKLKKEVTSYLENSWCSKEKINMLMDLTLIERPKVCVEIGVFTGSSLLPIATTLSYLNQGTVYAIDAWSNSEAVRYWSDQDPNKAWWSTVDMHAIYNTFDGMLNQWSLQPYCNVVKMSSECAIDSIPDEIDFLHLDGDYSEEGSMKDAELYLPKVKSGGYVLLSNLFTMVNNKQPKMQVFCFLSDYCEMVCEIERDNAILFKKN